MALPTFIPDEAVEEDMAVDAAAPQSEGEHLAVEAAKSGLRGLSKGLGGPGDLIQGLIQGGTSLFGGGAPVKEGFKQALRSVPGVGQLVDIAPTSKQVEVPLEAAAGVPLKAEPRTEVERYINPIVEGAASALSFPGVGGGKSALTALSGGLAGAADQYGTENNLSGPQKTALTLAAALTPSVVPATTKLATKGVARVAQKITEPLENQALGLTAADFKRSAKAGGISDEGTTRLKEAVDYIKGTGTLNSFSAVKREAANEEQAIKLSNEVRDVLKSVDSGKGAVKLIPGPSQFTETQTLISKLDGNEKKLAQRVADKIIADVRADLDGSLESVHNQKQALWKAVKKNFNKASNEKGSLTLEIKQAIGHDLKNYIEERATKFGGKAKLGDVVKDLNKRLGQHLSISGALADKVAFQEGGDVWAKAIKPLATTGGMITGPLIAGGPSTLPFTVPLSLALGTEPGRLATGRATRALANLKPMTLEEALRISGPSSINAVMPEN